MGWLATWKESV